MRPAYPLLALAIGGCVYLNTLYNAGTAWDRAEDARLNARSDSAKAAYARALDGASATFRQDSLGPWAQPALLLAGKAQLRLGNPAQAELILSRVVRESADSALVSEARLFLGAARWRGGDPEGAIAELNLALFGLEESRLRGEAHLWRGRVLLERGLPDQGFWDLERAAEAHGALRVPAALERVSFAVESGIPQQAASGLGVILSRSAAGVWGDSVSTLMRRARDRWGPAVAGELLAAAETSRWLPEHRTPLVIQRAGFLREAGDEEGAGAALAGVIRKGGPVAPRARLALARQVTAGARTPADLTPVPEILAPGRQDSELAEFLVATRQVRLLAEVEPTGLPGLFAAGELARDALGAPGLASYLLMQAAKAGDAGPWAGKAWLAASELRRLHPGAAHPGQVELERLRFRLARSRDPYLAAARNRYLPTDTLAALDRILQVRLDSALAWAAEALRRGDADTNAPGAR